MFAAVFAAAAISALFVGCLYVGVRGVPDRDDPAVIKQRFVRVGVASVLALVVVGIAASVPALQRSDPTCPAPASAARWLGVAAPLPTDALLLALLLPPALTSPSIAKRNVCGESARRATMNWIRRGSPRFG